MNYSAQLKSILKASDWSQEELAHRLGVSFVTINAWVSARSELRKKAREAIRLLMLAQTLRSGLVPPLVLKERKFAYYKYLELAQTKDNTAPLQLFIAESVIAANQLLFEK